MKKIQSYLEELCSARVDDVLLDTNNREDFQKCLKKEDVTYERLKEFLGNDNFNLLDDFDSAKNEKGLALVNATYRQGLQDGFVLKQIMLS